MDPIESPVETKEENLFSLAAELGLLAWMDYVESKPLDHPLPEEQTSDKKSFSQLT